jgi:hypothetical protein
MTAIIFSSLTSRPASMTARAARPSSLPWLTASRRISPVEILGIPRSRATRSAWVPFPAPGAPSITSRTLTPVFPPPA